MVLPTDNSFADNAFFRGVSRPRRPPLATALATQLHPLRDKIFLTAWPVSGYNTVVLDFLRAQPTSSLAPGVLGRTSGTPRCGKSSVAGLVQNKLIQFSHL